MISENIRYYGNVTLYYAAFIDHVRKLFNLTDKESNLVGLSKLYDTLICDRYLKRVVPLSDT
jgi:thymidylate kinase